MNDIPQNDAPAVDELSQSRQYWVSLGHDPARFDAAVARDALAPTGRAPNAEQALAAADALRAAGIDPEAVKAALANDGWREVTDTRTPEQLAFDADFPAPSPGDYRITYQGLVPPDAAPDWIETTNAETTASLAAMGLPAPVGADVAERALSAAKWRASASDVEKTLWVKDQRFELQRQCGSPEAAEAELRLAAETLGKASRAWIDRLGPAVREVGIVRLLARQTERDRYRAAMKT